MELMKRFGFWLGCMVVVCAGAFLAGCQSPGTSTRAQYKFDPLGQGGQAAATTSGTDASSGTSAVPVEPSVSMTNASVLHVGDGLTVTFQDLISPIPPVDVTIKEDGTITLIYNKEFVAAGKTRGELEKDIRNAYVPSYFKNMTPTVTIKDRYFTLEGEVKGPGRQVYSRMAVLEAIASAGGFTDFADRKHVRVTRADGTQIMVDCKKALDHPELNIEIFPGDAIFVKRKLF
jgi:protein involved in polysaccharide export with SLBB domain